jgi:hypothetical protein
MSKFRIFLTVLTFAVVTFPAYAQMFGKANYANSFDAAFAYYALTKQPIDIDALIKNDDGYKKLNIEDKTDKFLELQKKLNDDYSKFNPATSLLTVHTPVWLNIKPDTLGMDVTFQTKALPYFPFIAMEKTITLFPDGLKKFQSLPFENRDYFARIKNTLTIVNSPAEMILDLIPVAASKTDILFDRHLQLVVMCDIARVRVMTKDNGQILWMDTNKKYEHLFGTELRNLFAGPQGGKSDPFAPDKAQ